MTIQLPKTIFSPALEDHLNTLISHINSPIAEQTFAKEIKERVDQQVSRIFMSYQIMQLLNQMNPSDLSSIKTTLHKLPNSGCYIQLIQAKSSDLSKVSVYVYLFGVHAAFKELSPDIERSNWCKVNKVQKLETKIIATIKQIEKQNKPVKMITEITRSLVQRFESTLEASLPSLAFQPIILEKSRKVN